MKKYLLGLILSISVVVVIDPIAQKVSEPGYYKGTIVNINSSCGKSSCSHSLLIDWDRLNVRDSIAVSGHTADMVKKGDRYQTELTYAWWFGAAGTAYVPHDPEYSMFHAMLEVFARIGILVFTGFLIYPLLSKESKDDKNKLSDR